MFAVIRKQTLSYLKGNAFALYVKDAGFKNLAETLSNKMDAGFKNLAETLSNKMDTGFKTLALTILSDTPDEKKQILKKITAT